MDRMNRERCSRSRETAKYMIGQRYIEKRDLDRQQQQINVVAQLVESFSEAETWRLECGGEGGAGGGA